MLTIRRTATLGLTAVLLVGLGSGPGAADGVPAFTLAELGQGHLTRPTDGITRTEYVRDTGTRLWRVNVLVVDPKAAPLALKGTIGKDMISSETVIEMLEGTTAVKSRKPFIGVNGAFFDDKLYLPGVSRSTGDVGGLSIQGGRIQSEAAGGRFVGGTSTSGLRPAGSALVLRHGRPYISEFTSTLTIETAAAAPRKLDGVNRIPGRAPHCGQKDLRDENEDLVNGVCTDTSEIIEYTPEFGPRTPRPDALGTAGVPGVEVQLDAAGAVQLCKEGRGDLPVLPGGRSYQGIGEGADWLRANVCQVPGAKPKVQRTVTDTRFDDRLVKPDEPIDPAMYVTPVGDVLVRDGKQEYLRDDPTDQTARTAAGADGYGRLMLVTVDARKAGAGAPWYGASRFELAQLMLDLGAVDAVNLDGGGSTTLALRDGDFVEQLANDPTENDNGGQRPVGDTVYVGRGGYPLP